MKQLFISAAMLVALIFAPASVDGAAHSRAPKKNEKTHASAAQKVYPSFIGPIFDDLPALSDLDIDFPQGVKEMKHMTPVFNGDEEGTEANNYEITTYKFDTEGRLISEDFKPVDYNTDYRYTVTYNDNDLPQSVTLFYSDVSQDGRHPLLKYRYDFTYAYGRVTIVSEQLLEIENKPVKAPVYHLNIARDSNGKLLSARCVENPNVYFVFSNGNLKSFSRYIYSHDWHLDTMDSSFEEDDNSEKMTEKIVSKDSHGNWTKKVFLTPEGDIDPYQVKYRKYKYY